MKLLALEREIEGAVWKNAEKILKQEAQHVYQLYLAGYLQEIYFTENKNAVLILECEDKTTAKQLLTELPLVKEGMIDFKIMELQPYTGFSRLKNLE